MHEFTTAADGGKLGRRHSIRVTGARKLDKQYCRTVNAAALLR
jgi:hypothetical protein